MVGIYRRNTCTHTLIAAPFGSATGEEVFGFNRRLWNAHVKATIPVQDGGVGRLSYVAVDVTWHGSGRVQTDDHHDVVKQPTYTYIADTRDSARPADATGQITQDGTSIFDGPAISAAMTDTHFESRTISTQ